VADTEISVQVSYAEPERAVVKTYRLTPPAIIEDALRMARCDPDFAGVDLEHAAVGVFGRVAALSQALSEGDRVEIYRPLAADPKSARRDRVKEARKRR
jgi:putative ubiquitin-RnfH superfamily antitoxin RatB of RatAB toxin-antitoxin module